MLSRIKLSAKNDLQIVFWCNVVKGTRPLLLLHGHGGDHRGLLKLAKQLPVITFVLDLPGFGDSDELEAHTIDKYVAAIEAFAAQQNLAEYDVCGHSLGSAFALALAAHDSRVHKLILINPIPEFAAMIRKLIQLLSGTATKLPPKLGEALVHTRMYNIVTFLLHSQKKLDLVHAGRYMHAQNTAKYSLKAWQESGNAIYGMDQKSYAADVNAPTLIIHGDKDKMTSLKAVKSFVSVFKNAKLERLPKAGHFAAFENVDEVARLIERFLK